MAIASNGITPEVIRGVMPPYHLSPDLLAGTLRALAPPPADAATAWRRARIARLVQEIGGLMPADAPQARIAAGIVIVREAADDTFARSYAPVLTVEQLCRLRRTSADLARTAATLERGLARRQAVPAPFFGTVEADAVDIGALDAAWCEGVSAAGAGVVRQGAGEARADGAVAGGPDGLKDAPVPRGMAGSTPGTSAPPGHARRQAPVGQGLPAMTIGEMGEGGGGDGGDRGGGDGGRGDGDPMQPPAPDAEACLAVTPVPLPAEGKVWAQPRRSADTAARPGRDAGAAAAWTTTRLEQGPGWTLDVVRPPKGGKAGAGERQMPAGKRG